MTQIIKCNFNNAVYNWLPGTNGVGDIGGIRTGYGEGMTGSIPTGIGGKESFSNQTVDGRTVRSLDIYDSTNNVTGPLQPWADFWFSSSNTIGSDLTAWSLRALVSVPASNWNDVTIVALFSSATPRVHVRHFGVGGGYGAYWGTGGNAVVGQPQGWMRLEIQHDSTKSPTTVVRLYQNNGTTQTWGGPFKGSYGNANMVRFGDTYADNNTSAIWRVAELEVWNTMDGDGTFTNNWTTAQSNSYTGARRTTSYSIPAGYTTPSDTVSASKTTHSGLGYGNYNRTVNLYLPNGTPPKPSGFPLVMIAHGGYWVTGSPSDVPESLIHRLVNAGYAVACPRYLLSVLTNAGYSSYGTANSDSGSVTAYGRYPSHIVDYKLAAVRLRDRYAQGGTDPKVNDSGYGVDPDRIFAGGFSAGAYIGIAAAVSRDLTNDGYSRNMTITGNSSYRTIEDGSTPYTGADPTFIGAFGLATPNSMATLQAWDWTHNLTNAILWPPYYPIAAPTTQGNAGNARTAIRGFFARSANTTDPSGDEVNKAALTSLVAANSANVADLKVLNVRSDSDLVVHPQHGTDMAATFPSYVDSYTTQMSVTNHENCHLVYKWDDIETWLDTVTAASYPAAPTWHQQMVVTT